MKPKLQKAWNVLLDVLFPPRCVGCEEIVPIGQELCPACREIFSMREYRLSCVFCRLEAHECRCGQKQTAVCALPFRYHGVIRSLIHAFKFGRRRTLSAPFATAMADSVRMLDVPRFDVVCDVPMSPKRRRTRGFNQSEDLARIVAEKLDIPYEPLLEKVLDNQVQHLLPADERRENVRGVYGKCRRAKVRGRTILLCDDIMTTGATLNECVLTLKEGGAKEVYCVVASATGHGEEQISVN